LLAAHLGAAPYDDPPQHFFEADNQMPPAHLLVVTELVLEQLVPEML